MALDQDIRRFQIVTGSVPVTHVRGVVDPNGRCWYQNYDNAANDYTSPIVGKLTDITGKFSAMTGYALTFIDPDEPDAVSVAPTGGTTAGGTAFVITGTGLNSASCAVTIGGAAATTVRCNATTIAGVSPAGTAGAKDIVVTTAEGADTLPAAYTYS